MRTSRVPESIKISLNMRGYTLHYTVEVPDPQRSANTFIITHFIVFRVGKIRSMHYFMLVSCTGCSDLVFL